MPGNGALRIVTWNINSVRIRQKPLARIIKKYQPDVLCLQEIKVVDEGFPRDFFVKHGYVHQAVSGQKSYHGVAILSRLPLTAIDKRSWCDKTDCRHLAATLPNGMVLHNFYVPAGGDIPDPAANDKFAHKLQFVEEMTAWSTRLAKSSNRLIMVGDLNIAPLETDVWSHKQLLKVVSHTPAETSRMIKLQQSHDWVDAVRAFIPPEQKLYTWWSYRSPDWTVNDRGRRLDHIWVTPALQGALRGAQVVRDARSFEMASDHVPVIVDLEAG